MFREILEFSFLFYFIFILLFIRLLYTPSNIFIKYLYTYIDGI